ncbi:NAD(P)-binding protein [Cryphonectria parasitica EP155]|uniref:NAD(P)-binding protein n=1 Tax=Cryphonectria parasitica (strain ATCC 38755 / EP155) TaxID=660469 RepID=A0A9P4XUP3_CRYP1|nr:NAD(P)-binding protein [Cryphonectria parasitica EP155]KAF3761266.1 NAD(P)-binding protein [Cryphonectria parasitica EP155]
MSKPFVAVVGATGQLGRLIATSLRNRNVPVKAIVRPRTDPGRTEELRSAGVRIAEADLSDVSAVTEELRGATTVVSALNGLADTMLGAQGTLLDAAVRAGAKRFIPSDFSLDFTKTAPGSNRNLDLRREFHVALDASGIEWTSILNGAFMELLAGQAPLINDRFRRVLYWNSDEQPLDFTTYADTAAYTAAVAADPQPTPRYLRIAGDVVMPKELALIAGRARGGGPYSTLWVGSAGFLEGAASFMRRFGIGGSEKDVFPAWQGMQYTVNMFSGAGKLEPLDNDRYPELRWTKVEEFLSQTPA